MNFTIRSVTPDDKNWVLDVVRGWGADFIVSRGRKIYPAEIEGFLAVNSEGKRVGLVTFEINENQCEIVTLDAFEKFSGIGTALNKKVTGVARQRGCSRLWLITANDNLDAIRFYQRVPLALRTR